MIGLAWIVAGPARAVEPAVLVHSDLRREEIQFLGLGGGKIRFFGADRSLTSADASKIVRLEWARRPAQPKRPAGGPLLALKDGQVLAGRFLGSRAGNEQIGWENPAVGKLSLPLDDIASFTLTAGAQPPVAADNDAVLLANGDRLDGFIQAVDEGGLELERQGQAIRLGWESVRAVTLAGPVAPRPGVWLTMTDGSRIRVNDLVVGGERAAAAALGVAIDLPLDGLSRIDFTEHHRLTPLGELAWEVVSGGTAFGVEYPPRFDGGGETAALHAPITVRFTLPAGAARLAATAMLEPASAEQGDLALRVSDGSRELIAGRIHRQHPKMQINVELRGDTLLIEVDDAGGGPVHDRLRLAEAHVLVLVTRGR